MGISRYKLIQWFDSSKTIGQLQQFPETTNVHAMLFTKTIWSQLLYSWSKVPIPYGSSNPGIIQKWRRLPPPDGCAHQGPFLELVPTSISGTTRNTHLWMFTIRGPGCCVLDPPSIWEDLPHSFLLKHVQVLHGTTWAVSLVTRSWFWL